MCDVSVAVPVCAQVCSDKRADMKKIQDINDKIRKVLDELNRGRDDGAEPLTHTFFTPTLHALETPDVLLTVADEEVRVPRVLNAAEREQQAVEDRKAEDLRRLAAMDNPRERGLQVGGRGPCHCIPLIVFVA